MQALGEEYGFGLLGLDNFDTSQELPPEQATQINAILKAMLAVGLEGKGIISASPTAPSGFDDEKVAKKLKDAYETARDTMEQLFDEH